MKKFYLFAMVLCLLAVSASNSLFAQGDDNTAAKDDNAASAANPRFSILGAFSIFPPEFFDFGPIHREMKTGDSLALYDSATSYNLSLQLGAKLFGDFGAFIDFGFNDTNLGKAIGLMAKLNSKWFTIQLDYRMLSTPVKYWEDGSAYESQEPNVNKDFNQTWMTTGLMFNLPKKMSFMHLGLVYFQGAVPQILEVYNLYTDGKRYGFLADCPIWAFGFRMGLGWDHDTDDDDLKTPFLALLFPSLAPPKWTTTASVLFDFAWGKGTPDKDALKAAREVAENPDEFSASDYDAAYIRFYARYGLNYHKNFGKSSLIIGGGPEVNILYPYLKDSSTFNQFELPGFFGFYFRVGIKF